MKKLIATVFCALAIAGNVMAAPTVAAGFSRGEPSAKAVVLRAIADAKTTLHIAAYQLTSPDIIRAIIAAHKRGVTVAVMLDRTQASGDSQAAMVASGIACRIDGTYRIFHHKFMVVDGVSVEVGSFNYTLSADRSNAENALYIRNAPGLAKRYTAEFDRSWALPKTTPCPGGGQ